MEITVTCFYDSDAERGIADILLDSFDLFVKSAIKREWPLVSEVQSCKQK